MPATVLSRASGVIEDGKRLENLSWRLWCHETLYCSRPRRTHPSAHKLALRAKFNVTNVDKLPELSSSMGSVDSIDSSSDTDEGGDDDLPTPPPSRQCGHVCVHAPSSDSHKSKHKRRDNHITPSHLSQLVTCIKEKKDLIGPLSHSEVCRHDSNYHHDSSGSPLGSRNHVRTPRSSSPRRIATESSNSTIETIHDSIASHASDATTSSEASCHAVVHGFQLGGAGRSSYKSQSQLAAPQPILKTSMSSHPAGPRKKAGFQLGSSSDEDSVRDSLPLRMQSFPKLGQAKKQTSFKEDVEEIEPSGAASRQPKFHLGEEEDDSDAIESDGDEISDDDDEVSESAIEDDDGDWEDDPEEKDEPRALEFHRVDSKPNLSSHRSLLAEKVHEVQRAAALEEAAMLSTPPGLRRSRTSTPNGPLVSTSPENRIQMACPGSSISQARPIIPTTPNTQQPMALSPRTNRRNMLANELGTSLRKHLLWERQQRPVPPTTTMALPRRHTTQDLTKARQYPDVGGADIAPKVHLNSGSRGGTRNNSWNDYFDNGLGEYHQKGW